MAQPSWRASPDARFRTAKTVTPSRSLWKMLPKPAPWNCNSGHVFVVSNREPYMHQRNGKTVEVVVPPSGLVTALEPVLNACDGTWIAHGSGNADTEVVDAADRLRVPPEDPRYS